MKISIVIPTLNEQKDILHLITLLNQLPKDGSQLEIIVVDGGSKDDTIAIVKTTNALLYHSTHQSRAIQMNLGAAKATGDIFYFIHADTIPPNSLISDINNAINDGFVAGCYRVVFDIKHWFLNLNAWFSKFNIDAFRYGDQSLFVKSNAFNNIAGFNPQLYIFEDNDIILRLKRQGSFKIMPAAAITSARKYIKYGVFRLQLSYYILFFLYKFGASQSQLLKAYRLLVDKFR